MQLRDNKGHFLKGCVPFNKGKTISEETKKLISKKKKGIRVSKKTEFKKGCVPFNKGKKQINRETHWNWRGGISKERKIDMISIEYRKWRMDVFLRDNFTCQFCGVRGGYLEAHHIKEWSKYPALRHDLDNGVCLCSNCHNLTKKTKKTKNV